MKIEKEKIKLAPLSIPQIKINGTLFGTVEEDHMKVTPNQIEVLQQMAYGRSLQEIVRSFIDKGVVPSFEGIRQLVQFLVKENLLLNNSFKIYFENNENKTPGLLENLTDKIFGKKEEPIDLETEVRRLPLLRGLDPRIVESFLANSKLIESPPGIAVCQTGQQQRSLFVLIRGQASVYKHSSTGQRRKIAVLSENAIFGEVGFFLGEPRTADVITDVDSVILRIKYVPEIYDPVIKTDKARLLQKRIWLIHALLKSEVFREMPDDCFDALIFSGELKSFAPQSLIFKEGEFGDTCYIIVQGNLVVSQNGKSIRVLAQGDLFGEVALIMTGGKRTASIQAQTEVLALEIPAQKFYDLLGQNLMLACEFEKVALTRIRLDQAAKE